MTVEAPAFQISRSRAHFTLLLLFLLMGFDFIDRQVIAALLPAIKQDWQLSDSQLGLLVSAVNLSIAGLAVPIALVVDRWSRSKAIGCMAVIWSLATAACGLATNFHQLLLARAFVGAGEAGYGPSGNALLAASYPQRQRATVLGLFTSGALAGTVAGVILGGYIAQHWGWQHAFGFVAAPGLLLACAAFLLSDYRSQPLLQRDGPGGEWRAQRWTETLSTLLRSPVLLLIFLGLSAQLFYIATLANWLPSFFNRAHGMSLQQAGLATGMALLAGALGMAAGGWIVDRWSQGRTARRLFAAALFCVASALLLALAFSLPPGETQRTLIMTGLFVGGALMGPVTAAQLDCVHPAMRAAVGGVLVLAQNLFGMALGPLLAGWLSDQHGLQTTLLMMSLAPALAALCLGLAARRCPRAPDGHNGPQEVSACAS
ncbi:MFS transporter [Burkholderiaceae bacterium UC74_6]